MKLSLPELSFGTLRADALAGLLGAILALPQGIAFAKLAGLPPQYGIYSAIVPCAVAALSGSSRHVVSGPTNANSLALYAAVVPLAAAGSPKYVMLVLAVTALVGAIQVALGILRLAWITDFIAPSVLLGFISGAAILIGLYALPDVLGVEPATGRGVIGLLEALPRMLAQFEVPAVSIAGITLVVTLSSAWLSHKLPHMLIGITAGYVANMVLANYAGVTTVKLIGDIPSVVPPLSLPIAPAAEISMIFYIACALSIVALGQSISIAKALAERSGQQINVDRELIGQGLSNVVGSFFSCYVSCGSLNRSLPNFLAGARTSLAAFLSAVFLLLLALLTRPLLERIPLSAIGALLSYIAVGLLDARGFVRLARLNKADFAIASTTLVCMLILPFQQAIFIGIAFSLIAYLYRTAHPAVVTLVPDPKSPARTFKAEYELQCRSVECPQLKLVRIEGSIYFGAATVVARALEQIRKQSSQKHLLIMARSMNFIDLAGAGVWERELSARRAAGGDLYFHRPRASVWELWRKSGFTKRLGEKNVFDSKREAIGVIFDHLDANQCLICRARIFKECMHGAETKAH